MAGTNSWPSAHQAAKGAAEIRKRQRLAQLVEAEGQVLSIIPGKTPCLRCIMPSAPSCCGGGNDCCRVGVVGAVVPLISAIQAVEAIKILSGYSEKVNPSLVKYNFWENYYQKVDLLKIRPDSPCQCCNEKDFIYLEP
jgi:adenylyltransferase/sulfurtransferase